MLAWIVAGCHEQHDAVVDAGDERLPKRGDLVVVEQTAAEFFEGRVLGTSGDRLRVEVAGKSSAVLVALADVYRLPPVLHSLVAGQLAICNTSRHVWVPCKIEQPKAATVAITDVEGSKLDLPLSAVLEPSAVTALNLRRFFARNRARAAFAASVAQAGPPRIPDDWHPSPHERVIARDGVAWFSAHVFEIRDDDVRVSWDSDHQVSLVERRWIIPQPPYQNAPKRGGFVLLRPSSPSEPWRPLRVRSTSDSDVVVEDADGTPSHASLGDVVPLGGD